MYTRPWGQSLALLGKEPRPFQHIPYEDSKVISFKNKMLSKSLLQGSNVYGANGLPLFQGRRFPKMHAAKASQHLEVEK